MPVISNTTNEQTVLLLERARSFAWSLWFKLGDDRGTYDLTGCTITFTMLEPVRQGTDVVLTKVATLVDEDAGNAQLDFQALDLDLVPAIYPYSVTLLDADDFSATIIKGEVQILSNTDPSTANVYDTSSMDVLLKADRITVRVNHLKPPDLSIGIVDHAPFGTPPGASWRGSYPHYILDLLLPRGQTGLQGAPGADGTDGAPGADGTDGATWFTGIPIPNNALGRDGDLYLRSNGDYYYKIAGAWALQGSLKGPQGDQGIQGLQGLQGIQGEKGDKGDTGDMGPMGPPGGSDAATATYINDSATPSQTRAALDAIYATDADLAAHAADTSTHGVTEIVGRTEAQVLTTKTIALGSNTLSGTRAQFNAAMTDADFASLTGNETLTNKTMALGSNTVSGTLAQFNTALSDDDFCGLSAIQTLTNKTIALGSNTVSGTKAQFNTAMTDADFATLAGAETLTTKTIALGSNTVSGTKAQFNTAMTDADFATLDGAETLTNKTLTSPVINVGALGTKQWILCTAATRPAHSAGQPIFETDTLRAYYSNGTAWVPLSPSAQPLFKGIKTGGSITAGADIGWTSEINTGGGSFASGIYTIPIAGTYRLATQVKHDGSTAETGLGIYKNGSVIHYSPNVDAGGFRGSQTQTVFALAANDQISVRPQATATLVSDTPAQNSFLIVEYLRP